MATPPFLRGQHLSSITIAGVTVDGSGNLTLGAAQNIRAFISENSLQMRRDTEDIRPIWSRQKNHVVIGEGMFLRVTTLQRSDAANVLRQMTSNDVIQMVWTQGAETFTGYFSVVNFEGGIRGRGSNPVSLDLEPFDPGYPTTAQVTATP